MRGPLLCFFGVFYLEDPDILRTARMKEQPQLMPMLTPNTIAAGMMTSGRMWPKTSRPNGMRAMRAMIRDRMLMRCSLVMVQTSFLRIVYTLVMVLCKQIAQENTKSLKLTPRMPCLWYNKRTSDKEA